MSAKVSVKIDTDVESYPCLAIWEGDSNIEIPADMMQRLGQARRAVDAAELEIMRYVGTHYKIPMVREWLADHDEEPGT